ncbi:MAG: hypothetical protein ACRDBG_13945 [Waterburya sp.]
MAKLIIDSHQRGSTYSGNLTLYIPTGKELLQVEQDNSSNTEMVKCQEYN